MRQLSSVSAIFQRTSISRGQLRIQGVATCLYLCMDSCGLLYGSVSKFFFCERKLIYFNLTRIRKNLIFRVTVQNIKKNHRIQLDINGKYNKCY